MKTVITSLIAFIICLSFFVISKNNLHEKERELAIARQRSHAAEMRFMERQTMGYGLVFRPLKRPMIN